MTDKITEEEWKELDLIAQTIRDSGITALPEEDLEKDPYLDSMATLSLGFMALYRRLKGES